jgi:uncharacterized membrane protein YeaQ/YmgE (transglycosylase-associated protein family)
MFAAIALTPADVITWLVVGLLTGCIAGMVNRDNILGDIVMGVIGSVIGGLTVCYFVKTEVGIGGSMLASFVGACLLIAGLRALTSVVVRDSGGPSQDD